jgi:hypothetical protein
MTKQVPLIASAATGSLDGLFLSVTSTSMQQVLCITNISEASLMPIYTASVAHGSKRAWFMFCFSYSSVQWCEPVAFRGSELQAPFFVIVG